ncbi:MAG: diacylglycerol kinase family protein [Pirellulales bacterium]|nr:diacylglycerol kinase family protein [Pirellulales bacterium]
MISKDSKNLHSSEPGWVKKFTVAARGLYVAVSQEKSFIPHFAITAAVVVIGFALGISRIEWCIVVLCVMAGLGMELLNTAIERLAQAITREFHPDIRDALDIASAAVLIISIGAAVLGVLVLGNALWEWFLPQA